MKRFFAALLALLLLLTALPAAAQVYVEETPPEDWAERELLRITVFRTGEGDCLLLEAGGEAMMMDGGPFKYRESLRDALAARGIVHFKYLYNTHPHDDHIEGLRMLVEYGLEVEEFVSLFPREQADPEGNQKKAVASLDKAGVPYRQLTSGETLALGAAELTVIWWPDAKSINAQSPLTRLTFGDCSALFTADVTGDAQHYYLEGGADPAFLKADVVKAPHHGLTAFVKDFLTAVDPAYIFVTNYRRQAEKTENQAKYRKIPAQFSGDGTIVLECDGTDWYIHQTLKQF